MDGQTSSLIAAFGKRYGRTDAPAVYRAPGRVNLIGEHTDYNLGFVLPVALELACSVAIAPAGHGELRVYSENMDDQRAWDVKVFSGLQPAGDWSDYVAGVAVQLVKAGLGVMPADVYISSTVPAGGGLSSSAAIEVSTALALLGERPLEKIELAKLARAAEREFVGMPCGIMDQYISVFGQQNAALKIDCRSLGFEVVRLPADVEFVIVNSMVKHELGGSAYRDRVRECQEAVNAIRAKHPAVESLRDARMEMLDLAEGIPRKRARHVITENARVEEFLLASAGGDTARMGDLMTASHISLRDDYEVSCDELNFLVETALEVDGVRGARMTGGGFGGCTINLLDPGQAGSFRQVLAAAYRREFHLEPEVYPCHPSAGAGRIA